MRIKKAFLYDQKSGNSLVWIKKAQNDLKTGKDEFATADPATDTICFHMQQTVEKFLKAFIIYCGHEAEKTHNISRILEKCISIDKEFSQLIETGIELLTPYGTVVRYPDDFHMPGTDETAEAIKSGDIVKEFVMGKLRASGFDVQ